MRWLSMRAIVLTIALLALMPATARAACARPGERVVADGADVQVLRDGERRIACLKRSGRRVLLTTEYTHAHHNHRVRSFVVNGRHVAWWAHDQQRYGTYAHVRVARLPHGPRRRVRVDVGNEYVPRRPLALAVGTDGSVAWALEWHGVFAAANGLTRRVGYLDGRAPVALRVGGGQVGWTVNEAAHGAQIRPAGTCGVPPFGEVATHDRSLSVVRERGHAAVCRHGDHTWQVLPDGAVGHVSIAGDFVAWSNGARYETLREWDASTAREVGSAVDAVYVTGFGGGWGLRQDGALFFQELQGELVALVRRDAGGTREVLATEPPGWGFGIRSTGSRVFLSNDL